MSTLVRDDGGGPGAVGGGRARGHTLRIVDLGGNQAVDCIVYDAHDHAHRYSAAATITAQRNIFLVAGHGAAVERGAPDG